MWVRYDAKPVGKADFTGSEVLAVCITMIITKVL